MAMQNGTSDSTGDVAKIGNEFIDTQYRKPDSSVENYERELCKHCQDPTSAYLSLRLEYRSEFLENLEEPQRRQVVRELERIKKARKQFSSYANKKALMEKLRRRKKEWREEVAKNVRNFEQEVEKSQRELSERQAKVVSNHPGFKRELAKLRRLQEQKTDVGGELQKDLEKQWAERLDRKYQRHSALIQRLKGWAATVPETVGLNPAEEDVAPKPLYGLKANVMHFRLAKETNTLVGYDYKHPKYKGLFPNQKIRMHEILNERNENPLMEECPQDDVRYFHFPTNNMSWIETAIARYYREEPKPIDDRTPYNPNARKTEKLLAHTIITSFPRRWGRNKPDSSGVHKTIRERLETRKEEIKSIYHLALIIVDQCSRVFFDRTKPLDERPEVMDLFASAIGHITDMTTIAYDVFWRALRTGNVGKKALDLNPEGVLFREAQDIAEELKIMKKTYTEQLKVVKDFKRHLFDPLGKDKQGEIALLKQLLLEMTKNQAASNDGNAPSEGEEPDVNAKKAKAMEAMEATLHEAEGTTELIESRQAEIQDLEDSALRTYQQQQISIVEANAAVQQGQSIMALTIVTIFFLPLGFFAAFFGMNNAEINESPWMTLNEQIGYMFGLSSIVIMISISIAFNPRVRAILRPILRIPNRILRILDEYIPIKIVRNKRPKNHVNLEQKMKLDEYIPIKIVRNKRPRNHVNLEQKMNNWLQNMKNHRLIGNNDGQGDSPASWRGTLTRRWERRGSQGDALDAPPSLWGKAFDALSDEDKTALKPGHGQAPPQPSEIVQAVEEKKKDCEKKQWVLYTNGAGEKVLVRDTLSKSSFKRALKSTINTTKSVVEEPILCIEKQEDEVFKLVSLVQDEVNGSKLDDIIERLRQSVEDSHASNEEIRKRLSAWINGIDTKNTYETALQYHHSGTCEWVIQLPEYHAWISGENPGPRLMWIHGPAGFGKTFLSAWIIRHLEQQKQAPLSYFFCVADNKLTRDPYAILQSWLTQMAQQDEGIMLLFSAIGDAVQGCTFVVAGFDECTDIDTGARYHHNDPRNIFLCELLKNLRKTKSRVMVVSRDVPDIREYLGQDDSSESDTVKRLEYGITAKDTTADVQSFSESMVNKKLSKKPEKLRQKIASQAAERSEGMFLWIKLLEQEISPGQNAKQLTKTVTEMPSGISDAYSRELEKIVRLSHAEKAKAVMILRWTLFAIRPLQVKQLAEALVVSDEDLDEYPEDDLPDTWYDGFVDEDYVKEMILGRCGSLLQLRASSSETPLADHTVHFVHFSRNFGLADAVAEDIRLSNICLRYLTLNTFKDIPQNTEVYPFLSYAAWAWYFHSFHEKPTPSEDIIHRTQKAFDPSISSWKVWTPLMEAELTDSDIDEWVNVSDTDSETDCERHGRSISQEVETPIYYASLLGLIDVVKWLEGQGLECGCAGGRFGFPLQAAVARNHVELVKYLLNRHVNVSQEGGQFGASIVAAAAMSTPEIVRILLSAGANVMAADESGWTALHHAAKRGNVEIVQLLLDRGVNINAMTDTSLTATNLACLFGHRDVLSVLAQRGADLNSNGNTAEPPLQVAIEKENESLVDVLLNNGVSANAVFPDGSTALNRAISSLKLVKKLLEMGAMPDMADKEGWTPLQVAASYGDLGIVKALIDAGASVACNPDSDAGTHCALQAAVVNSHLSTAKFLFEHGADLDQKTAGSVTALILAIKTQNRSAVEWLLDMGASLQCICENSQRSAFDIAAKKFDLDMMELLVRRGCFQIQTSTCGSQSRGSTAAQILDNNGLVMLAYNGDLRGVNNLLTEANSPLPAHVLGEALHAASARGHLPIAKVLLKNRAKVNLEDLNGRVALHYATRHLHLDVAELLVDHGASVSIEDMVGSTPVDLAIVHGERGLEFIQNYMDNFTLNISRRPSLLAVTQNQPADFTAMGTRKAISGHWTGHYEYLSWQQGEREPFSINIPAESHQGSQPYTFSNRDTDDIGPFQFHGFVDSIDAVWLL
ncbi:hypothetical protein DL768_007272 [Monosporascus sp. mg162]|nr:hypothetical protein DL768_007272 [Monosporascus sp. mg162]